MEQPLLLNLDEVMKRIGYGRYQICAFLAVSLIEFSFGVEIILLGVFEKILKRSGNYSDSYISMLCTLIAIGFPIGLVISLLISFKYKRTLVLKVSHIMIVCSVICASLVENHYLFVVFRAFANIGIGIGVPLVYSFVVESSPSYNRGYFSLMIEGFFIAGQLVTLGCVYFLMPNIDGDNWTIVFLTPYIAHFIPISVLFFYLKETPWYLFKKGHKEELFNALEFISQENSGKPLQEDEKKINFGSKDVAEITIAKGLKILFRKEHRGTILKLTWVRISLIVGFIGTPLFVPFMFKIENFYLNYLVSIFSIFIFLIVAMFMVENKYFGRKNTLLTNELALGAMAMSLIVFRDSKMISAVIIGLICGLSSVTNNISAQFVSELFQTDVRVAASTIINLIARSQLAYLIFVVNYLTQFPIVLFTVLALFFSIGTLVLHTFKGDTKDKVLDSHTH